MATQLLFIGTTELLLVGGLALLLFGGKKLPEMMRGLGQGVKEFKKGVNDVNQEMNQPISEEPKNEGSASDNSESESGDENNQTE